MIYLSTSGLGFGLGLVRYWGENCDIGELWDIWLTDVGSIETVAYFYLFWFFLILEAVSSI